MEEESMQKTKIGVSVGLLGAAIYFMGLFSGYLTVVLLIGYVLLFEENEWLRKSAVKAVALMVVFSLAAAVMNLIPNVIGVLDNLASIFGGSFHIAFLSSLVYAVTEALDILEKLLFMGLGVRALTQGTIAVPAVDGLINKYMG